jgi:signal transduction histidine kinase
MGHQFHPATRQHARRRLRRLVLGSLLCLAMPLALLLSRVYTQLEREVVYQYRVAAEEAVYRLNQRLADMLQAEENRAFDEYSFLKVTTNPLLQGTAVTTSPLSELPPKSAVPGVIGYFQINPDGSVQSPVLPELGETELSANVERFGFGAPELAKRLTLRRRLEHLLRAGTPVAQPKSSSALPLSEPMDQSADAAQGSLVPAKGTTFLETDALRKDVAASANLALRDAELAVPPPGAPAEFRQQTNPVQQFPGTKASPYRGSRKEQVALPEQSTASQVQGALERLNTMPQSPGGQTVSGAAARQQAPAAAEPQAKRQEAVKILTFESEVDPFQFTVLPGGPLVFFRKAWRNNLRYIQGFVVDQNEFLQPLIEASTNGTTIAQQAALAVQYKGNPLFTSLPMSPERAAPATSTVLPIYRTRLATPLEVVELVFSVSHIPRGTSATVVDLLVLALVLVLVAGHYGIYRVGMQHIELAAQRSDFVSAVSHELKTPLTSIRMYGEMLRAGWITDDTRRQAYYNFIFFESERLSRLIANVLQLARLTNHDAPLPLKEYSLRQLLDLVRSKVSTQVEAASFALQLVEPADAQTVDTYTGLADADAFVQIFINLVDNAIKFSANAEQKCIAVGLRLPPGRPLQAVFFVRDYGPGVARDQMPRIFQLFYRAENELTRHTQGTGIGLALVKALATKMHAKVEVQNQTPGAEFRLLLPVVRRDAGSRCVSRSTTDHSPRVAEGNEVV